MLTRLIRDESGIPAGKRTAKCRSDDERNTEQRPHDCGSGFLAAAFDSVVFLLEISSTARNDWSIFSILRVQGSNTRYMRAMFAATLKIPHIRGRDAKSAGGGVSYISVGTRS